MFIQSQEGNHSRGKQNVSGNSLSDAGFDLD
jgi:hypothetical protein